VFVKKSYKIIFLILCIGLIINCSKNKNQIINQGKLVNSDIFLRGVDLSVFPEIKLTNPIFYNLSGQAEASLVLK